jgi:hypothetical protein
LQTSDGALRNVIDDPNSFPDTASTALMGSVAFRMLALLNTTSRSSPSDIPGRMLNFANGTLSLVHNNLSPDGWVLNTVNPYTFNVPSGPDEHSPESQAFVLLLQAAWNDWISSATTRGLGEVVESASAQPKPTTTYPAQPTSPAQATFLPPSSGKRSTAYCALRRKQ